MFWQKKSIPPKDRDNYISFYLEDGELKVEFGFDDIDEITLIADQVLNGRVRNSCFEVMESKIRDGGLQQEAAYFSVSVNKTIKPSEYAP